MDAIRAFIAIELPAETRRRLGEIIQEMQARLITIGGEGARKTVRWVPPDNIHLTLKFLGEVSSGNVQALASMMKMESARHQPFTLQIGGSGAFPNPHRPRVIWVGSQAPSNLAALQQSIETETRTLGYPTEERAFSPHLTLGRVSQNANAQEVGWVSQALASIIVGDLGSVPVKEIHLFRSDLQPAGAVYTSLYAFPLGKPVTKSLK